MTEQQRYEVQQVYSGFELRRYPAHLEAQVTVNAGFEEGGGSAYSHLFGYLRGGKIAMTTPVLVRSGDPEGCVTVAFILPRSMTAGEVPLPADPAVSVIEIPEGRGAVAGFSGRWTLRNFSIRDGELESAVRGAGLLPLGPALFALFDPPYKPAFLRRNEVIRPVE